MAERRFIVDERGERRGVLLDWIEYQKLLEAAEELDAIRAYDEATSSKDEAVPLEQALDEIERERA